MDTTHSLDDAFDKICRKTTLMIEQLVHPDGVHSSLLNVCLSQLGPQRNERMLLGKKKQEKKLQHAKITGKQEATCIHRYGVCTSLQQTPTV